MSGLCLQTAFDAASLFWTLGLRGRPRLQFFPPLGAPPDLGGLVGGAVLPASQSICLVQLAFSCWSFWARGWPNRSGDPSVFCPQVFGWPFLWMGPSLCWHCLATSQSPLVAARYGHSSQANGISAGTHSPVAPPALLLPARTVRLWIREVSSPTLRRCICPGQGSGAHSPAGPSQQWCLFPGRCGFPVRSLGVCLILRTVLLRVLPCLKPTLPCSRALGSASQACFHCGVSVRSYSSWPPVCQRVPFSYHAGAFVHSSCDLFRIWLLSGFCFCSFLLGRRTPLGMLCLALPAGQCATWFLWCLFELPGSQASLRPLLWQRYSLRVVQCRFSPFRGLRTLTPRANGSGLFAVHCYMPRIVTSFLGAPSTLVPELLDCGSPLFPSSACFRCFGKKGGEYTITLH